eukprot:RCo000310
MWAAGLAAGLGYLIYKGFSGQFLTEKQTYRVDWQPPRGVEPGLAPCLSFVGNTNAVLVAYQQYEKCMLVGCTVTEHGLQLVRLAAIVGVSPTVAVSASGTVVTACVCGVIPAITVRVGVLNGHEPGRPPQVQWDLPVETRGATPHYGRNPSVAVDNYRVAEVHQGCLTQRIWFTSGRVERTRDGLQVQWEPEEQLMDQGMEPAIALCEGLLVVVAMFRGGLQYRLGSFPSGRAVAAWHPTRRLCWRQHSPPMAVVHPSVSLTKDYVCIGFGSRGGNLHVAIGTANFQSGDIVLLGPVVQVGVGSSLSASLHSNRTLYTMFSTPRGQLLWRQGLLLVAGDTPSPAKTQPEDPVGASSSSSASSSCSSSSSASATAT